MNAPWPAGRSRVGVGGVQEEGGTQVIKISATAPPISFWRGGGGVGVGSCSALETEGRI